MALDIDLTGRTAIVTGAGRGIGRVICSTFAEAGADVVAAARSADEIEAAVDEVEDRFGVEALAVPTDLREADDIAGLVEAAVDRFGTPEILINNAGANLTGPPLEHTLEEIDTMLDVNLRGLFVLSQHFGRAFRADPADVGRIVNVSSISAQIGVPAMTLYGGTKSGIYGVTRGLAAELAADGVTVNSVTPGLTRVGRVDDLLASAAAADIYDLDRVPLGRLGLPSDVATACAFLASDLAGYITGEDVRVDGGVGFTAGLYR